MIRRSIEKTGRYFIGFSQEIGMMGDFPFQMSDAAINTTL